MKIDDYGQMLSAVAGFEAYLLALWGFFYTGHAGLVVAVYHRKRRLSLIEAAVLFVVYAFAWKVNFGGIEDAYQHLQLVYTAMGNVDAPLPALKNYYETAKFWGPGAGLFDRSWVVPTIYRIAFILTSFFIIGCHVVTYDDWWHAGPIRRKIWTYLLPVKDAGPAPPSRY